MERSRTAEKREMIASYFRAKIGVGELRAGDRLPTQLELARQFSVSPVTVQSALSQMAREGFLRAEVPRGTFVADRPPHLNRFALVMWDNPSVWQHRSRFLDTLVYVAREIEHTDGIELPVFHEALDHSSKAFADLVQDVRDHRLGGLILCLQLNTLKGTAVLDEPDIPRIAVGGGAEEEVPSIQIGGFMERAFERLQALGRTRAAVLVNGLQACPTVAETVAAAATYGVDVDPAHVQAIHIDTPVWAAQAVRLLFAGKAGRPDALVITDDHLVEHATAGLRHTGLDSPEALTVIAHCNFPLPPPSQVPVLRLGPDLRFLLRASVQNLQAQRQGRPYERRPQAPVIFEDEVGAS